MIVPSAPVPREQVDADEVGDVAGPGLGGDVAERAGLHDRTAFEDDDAVGEGVGVDGVVGDEEADAVERGEVAAEVAADVAAGAGVEGGERFVEQEQARLGGQRAGEGDALRLAARQGAGAVMCVVGEPDPIEPGRGSGSGLRFGDAAGAQPEGDVLERGQVGEQQVVLEDDADGSAFRVDEDVGGRVVERLAVELDAALVDRQQPGEAAEQGALAGAVGAEHGDGLAALRGEVDVEAERCRACARCAHRASWRRWSAAAEEAVAQGDEHGEGDGDQHEAQHDRFVGVDLVGEVDRQAASSGCGREVAGEGDRRAELAQRPRPGEHGAGDEAGTDGRQGHAAEHVPA